MKAKLGTKDQKTFLSIENEIRQLKSQIEAGLKDEKNTAAFVKNLLADDNLYKVKKAGEDKLKAAVAETEWQDKYTKSKT